MWCENFRPARTISQVSTICGLLPLSAHFQDYDPRMSIQLHVLLWIDLVEPKLESVLWSFGESALRSSEESSHQNPPSAWGGNTCITIEAEIHNTKIYSKYIINYNNFFEETLKKVRNDKLLIMRTT